MTWLRRRATLVIAGILALAAGAWIGWVRIAPEGGGSVAPLWSAQLQDLHGRAVDLNRFRGRPLIVNFWATWCGPCKEEMPDFQRLAASTLGKRIQIIGIGIDNADNMREFAEKLQISYPLLVGGAQAMDLMKAMGNRVGGLPYTVIYDGRGNLTVQHLGRISASQLNSAAERAASM
ncbi:MAG: TlpA family protein disulfide reductase [Burkholderiales bacterium]|nr:TlpA family protein disulfide reductase [Burkholderiales bacterium]